MTTPDIPELAHHFIQSLPQEILEHHVRSISSEQPEGPLLTPQGVDCIADNLQEFIAYVIAGLLDAGSERDAVMEDELLANTLRMTLRDW